MKNPRIYTVPVRRKHQQKTNYKKRRRLLLCGKTRLVVRKKGQSMEAAFVQYTPTGDKTVAAASLSSLRKSGWKYSGGNMPAAYLIGYLAGAKAKGAKVTEAVLDAGISTPFKQSRVYAVLAGVLDAGVSVPHDESVLPSKERTSGKHIADYGAKLKENNDAYAKQFGNYVKQSIDPADIGKAVDAVKTSAEK